MIELPETEDRINVIGSVICGKRIVSVSTAPAPYRLACHYHDPQNYHKHLVNMTIDSISSFRGIVQVKVGAVNIIFSDGIELRLHRKREERTDRHQLFIEFDDSSCLSASFQLYGAIWFFLEDELVNPYFGKQI